MSADPDFHKLIDRLENLRLQILKIRQGRHRLTLTRMHSNALDMVMNANKIWVTARKSKVSSLKYQESLQKALEAVDNLEQYVFMALLIEPEKSNLQ